MIPSEAKEKLCLFGISRGDNASPCVADKCMLWKEDRQLIINGLPVSDGHCGLIETHSSKGK